MLCFERRALASTDYTNGRRSAIAYGPLTIVVNGAQAKVYAMYDNEWAYACRLVHVALMVGVTI